jgi:hypothetical protein
MYTLPGLQPVPRYGPEQALGLLRAHDERQSLRLLEVVDRGGEIVPPQRDAKQIPHSGQDPVAIADAQPAPDQVQLEAASAVAVSGERPRNAANRLQLWMWLLCAWRPSYPRSYTEESGVEIL